MKPSRVYLSDIRTSYISIDYINHYIVYHIDLDLSNRELHFSAQVTLAQAHGCDILPGATQQTDNREERRSDWKHDRHHAADPEA